MQHLPAIVPIEIARIFLRRTFWVRKLQYASPASFRRELPRQAMEFGSLSHKGQGERECLHVFNATKHAHVTVSAKLLLERIWSVEDGPWGAMETATRATCPQEEAGRGRRGAFVPLPSPLEHGPERGNEVVPQPA